MFSPDGDVGDVPAEKAGEAAQAGFKVGMDMLSPDSQPGVIPVDRVHDALAKGFQIKPPATTAAKSNVDMQEDPLSGWEHIKAGVGYLLSGKSVRGLSTQEEQQLDDLAAHPAEGSYADRLDKGLQASLPNMVGGGLVTTGEEGLVLASPVLKRVAQRFIGTSKTYQAFVQALHGEEEAQQVAEDVASGASGESGAKPEPVPPKTVKQSQSLNPNAKPQRQAAALADLPAPDPTLSPEVPSADEVPEDEWKAGHELDPQVDNTPKPEPAAPKELKASGKDAAEDAFLKNLGKSKEDVAAAQQKGKLAYQKHLTKQAVGGAEFGPRGGATPQVVEKARAAGRVAYLKHLGISEFDLENAKSAARQGYMQHLKKGMADLASAVKNDASK